MKRIESFINLTNGLEIVNEELPISMNEFQFVRLQSTHLEGNWYDLFLQELDHNLLMYLAMGYRCYIYDYGSRRKDSQMGQARALWQGVLWVRFVLNRVWLKKMTDEEPLFYLDGETKRARSTDLLPDFKNRIVTCFSENKPLRRRIKYFEKYVNPENIPNGIRLYGVYKYTTNDGNGPFFIKCAEKYRNNDFNSISTKEK
jgi:hypothetical protein